MVEALRGRSVVDQPIAFLMLLPSFEKKLEIVSVDLGFAATTFFLLTAAWGGGIVAVELADVVGVELAVVGATVGEAVPAVVPLEAPLEEVETTPTRSGLGSAVPSTVAGVGVLVPEVVVARRIRRDRAGWCQARWRAHACGRSPLRSKASAPTGRSTASQP